MVFVRTILLAAAVAAGIVPVAAEPVIIIKADDLRTMDTRWVRFFDCVADKGINVSVGLIGQFIDTGTRAFHDRLKELHAGGTVEFWNHGYTHTKDADGNPEFQNQSYDEQLATIRKTQTAGKNKLGITFAVFGAPFNGTDTETARAVRDCGEIAAWFYGRDIPEKGDVLLLKRENVEIEYPTLVPDYDEFRAEYDACSTKPVLNLQCHPGCWNDAQYNEFVKIIDFLIARGCRFETPSEYCGIAVTPPQADTVAPAVTDAAADLSGTTVTVFFNETVDKTTAETAANYTISGGIAVTAARLLANGCDVELTVLPLALNVDYTLTVTGVGDRADPVNVISGGSTMPFRYELCITSTALWQSQDIEEQTGTFTVTCNAVPLSAICNGLFTLSAAAAGGFSDCAVLVRFNDAGVIDARNGGDYAAVNTLAYALNTAYRFEVMVDVAAHRYDVTVTPDGGSPVVIADDFAFRTEQAAATNLQYWNMIDDRGDFKVCNVTVEPYVSAIDHRSGSVEMYPAPPVYYSLSGKRIIDAGPVSGIYIRYDAAGGARPVLNLR